MDERGSTVRSEAEAAIEQAADAFSYRTMRLFFVGGLLLTLLLVGLSVLTDAGPQPPRRFALLTVVLAGWGLACGGSRAAADALRRSPSLVLAFSAILVAGAALDGGLHHSILESEEYILLGVGAVLGEFRRVLWVSALLSAGMVATLPFGPPSRALFTEPVLSDLVTQWGLTAVLVAFLLVLRRMRRSALDRLYALRGGAPVPVHVVGTEAAVLPTEESSPIARLSATEWEVVGLLARGLAPKEIAFRNGKSLHTIRNQIKSAMRKTGASKTRELVALFCRQHPDAPVSWADRGTPIDPRYDRERS